MSLKEKEAKEAIKKLHPILIKQIDPEWIHEFLGEHLITSNEKERIDAATTRTDKNSKLLDALQRRSNFLKVIETLIRLFEEDKEVNEKILKKIESGEFIICDAYINLFCCSCSVATECINNRILLYRVPFILI